MKNNEEEIVVSTLYLGIMGLGGTILFTFSAICSAVYETLLTSALFVPFILMSVFCCLFCGKIHLNTQGIGYENKFGQYFLAWDDIETVELGSGNFVLGNKEKRIAMPGPGYWNGKEKTVAIEMLLEFLVAKNIQIKETFKASFQFSKNTKITIKPEGGDNG